MLNQVIIVGRLVSDPEIKETENGNKVSYITLAVPRSYKNSDGIYETDFMPCKVGYPMRDTVKEYCKKGDLIGVRGRLQCLNGNELQLVAEKVSFLSSRKEEDRD